MKLYLISQTENSNYDTYDSAVVCAENEEAARNMMPFNKCWCSSAEQVSVEYLGETDREQDEVILARFNAG